eukprot:CAMPEP_0196642038 /NCGR_PEP_ID=MMETSP1085-20130531/4251_1 /TAXON_ID=41879 ORGANISM="Pycnococcus sp, Strain CCMP1998" /NCGR_SAMPLE_ID=MMETSP1085 /ASSEMBLY_ACC=CAM_ASM_000807 /LENGTH=92 /DNA_ID=CAMNT_0041971355 /DNA_START=97 /DNA_END=374 /DNA_ORIENTATION=+
MSEPPAPPAHENRAERSAGDKFNISTEEGEGLALGQPLQFSLQVPSPWRAQQVLGGGGVPSPSARGGARRVPLLAALAPGDNFPASVLSPSG